MKTNTGERKERVLSDLPFSKKVAAAIRNVPLKSAQAKPPPEMTDALKKTFQNLGADYAVDQAEVLAPLKARFEKEFTGHSIGDAFEHGNKILSEIMRDCAT